MDDFRRRLVGGALALFTLVPLFGVLLYLFFVYAL